ncbi:MAG: Ig-like domain-containing protein [Promethearchaeota archaeon]
MKKKFSLLAISLALAFILLSVAPQVLQDSRADPTLSLTTGFNPSDEITPGNIPPKAVDDIYTANEGITLSVPSPGVLANDIDLNGNPLTAQIVDYPAFGDLTLYPDGSFDYFVVGWSGPVIFTYTAFDGTDYSNLATVIIDVIGDDDTTGPDITFAYTGGLTDGNPGFWTVSVVDPESGVASVSVEIDGVSAGTAAGVYPVPNTLGTHTITVTAKNADLDTGLSDQETSVSSNAVTITDDDVTGPSIFITYTGDSTDTNPGFWNVAVSDSLSGVYSILVKIDGLDVGNTEGDYKVPSSVGDHTITVTAVNNDMDRPGDQETSVSSSTVTIIATITPTELTYTGEVEGAYSDPVHLEAQLIDALTGLPIEGKAIVFALGSQTATAVTNQDGVASYVLILDQEGGFYTLSASFGGDDDYLGSTNELEFFLAKEYAYAEYTGRTVVPVSENSITLMATIFDEDDGYWGDMTRIYVTFSLYLSSELVYTSGPVMVQLTEVDGVGLATHEFSDLTSGEYSIVVSLNSVDNHYYYGHDTDATLTIYEPERASVSGAGWIKDADGHRVFFVFNVKYSWRGRLTGFLILTYMENKHVYVMKSTKILGFVVDGNHAFFEAVGRINEYNFHWHRHHCPTETFTFRVDAWDNKKSHEDDVFQIRVLNKNGLIKYQAGFEPFGYLIHGNIKTKDNWCKHRW